MLAGDATDANGDEELMVARLNADGSFDSSFGSGGKVLVSAASPLRRGARLFSCGALVVQRDGKLVLAGDAADGGLVARLNADGSLDSSFGSGGTTLTQLGAGQSPNSEAISLAVQGDGKLVVAGDAFAIGIDTPYNQEVLVARLNSNGSLDSSFGSAGGMLAQLGAGFSPTSIANAVAVQGDGKPVVAVNANSDVLVARLNANGSFDSSFGSGGKVPGGGYSATALALHGDGKVVLAGGNSEVLVARLNSQGGFDSSFGFGGKVLAQLGAGGQGAYSVASALAVQGDGKLVVAGVASQAFARTPADASRSHWAS